MFRKIGMEPAAATGIPGAMGDVLVCEIYTKRVAGEFDEAPKEAETERERPIKIWLARFDNTQIRYPGKLEAQTLLRHHPRPGPVVPRAAADAGRGRSHPALRRRHDLLQDRVRCNSQDCRPTSCSIDPIGRCQQCLPVA